MCPNFRYRKSYGETDSFCETIEKAQVVAKM